MARNLLGTVVSTLLVAACTNTTSSSTVDANSGESLSTGTQTSQALEDLSLQSGDALGNITFPRDTVFDSKNSIILGSGENAYGKILGEVKSDSALTVQFFKENMPSNGWQLVNEIQDDDTTIIYQNDRRVVVLQIERSASRASFRVTISPRS